MAETTDNSAQKKDSKIPLLLFIFLIIAGIVMAFFINPQNDIQRFCFAIVISLAAGLGATYLTGKITGGGKFGFLNVRSATGGFFVWLITLATFLYFFPKQKTKSYPKMAGEWTYICTGHNSKYQHGGRFTATQEDYLWTLKGERMWKDTFNTAMDRWDCTTYNPTKSWHSVAGYVEDNTISFEYVVENVNGEDIHGYAKGDLSVNENNEIIKIKGIFNQLYPSKQISGDIEFIRVSKDNFEKPQWVKNHDCNN
jgi:hypothetical protein